MLRLISVNVNEFRCAMSISIVYWALITCLNAAYSQQQSKMPSAVLELNEKFLEVKDTGHWLIEFYAPWCGHCKRLAPVWEQLGHTLVGSHVRVGKLDCTRFPKAATAIGVNAYPTIKFFRDGHEILYEGDRNKDAIMDFVSKASGPEVRALQNEGEFRSQAYDLFHSTAFFVLLDDGQNSDHQLVKQFHETASKMFTKTYFFSSKSENIPAKYSVNVTPAVLVIKDNFHAVFDAENEFVPMIDWVNSERWPTLTAVTFGNFYDLTQCCNKLTVLAVLDIVQKSRKDSPIHKVYNVVKKVAETRKAELSNAMQFGWLDGNELANNIVLATMKIPSLMVFNGTSYEYFLPDDSAEQMTEESLFMWLENVVAGGTGANGGKGIFQKFKRMGYEVYTAIHGMFSTQPLLSCCLFGLPLGILSIICYTICTTDASYEQEEIYPESEEEESDHEKRE